MVAWSFLSTSVLTINKEEYRFSEDAETTAYDSTDSSSRSPRCVCGQHPVNAHFL